MTPSVFAALQPEVLVGAIGAVSTACALLWAAAASLANRRLRSRQDALAADMDALRNDLMTARLRAEEQATLAEKRLLRMEQAHARVTERLRDVERRADGRSFDLAIDSARQGLASAQLAADFSLSRGEADLIARLHGRTPDNSAS